MKKILTSGISIIIFLTLHAEKGNAKDNSLAEDSIVFNTVDNKSATKNENVSMQNSAVDDMTIKEFNQQKKSNNNVEKSKEPVNITGRVRQLKGLRFNGGFNFDLYGGNGMRLEVSPGALYTWRRLSFGASFKYGYYKTDWVKTHTFGGSVSAAVMLFSINLGNNVRTNVQLYSECDILNTEKRFFDRDASGRATYFVPKVGGGIVQTLGRLNVYVNILYCFTLNNKYRVDPISLGAGFYF